MINNKILLFIMFVITVLFQCFPDEVDLQASLDFYFQVRIKEDHAHIIMFHT